MLPQITAGLPEDVKLKLLGDQSAYVRATIAGVLREVLDVERRHRRRII